VNTIGFYVANLARHSLASLFTTTTKALVNWCLQGLFIISIKGLKK
jgi:hypothetical protein